MTTPTPNPLAEALASKLHHPLAWTYGALWSIFNWSFWPHWFSNTTAAEKIERVRQLDFHVWYPLALSLASVLVGAPSLRALLRIANDWFGQIEVQSEAQAAKARRKYILGGLEEEVKEQTAEAERLAAALITLRAERSTLELTQEATKDLQRAAESEKAEARKMLELAKRSSTSDLFDIVLERTTLDVPRLRDANERVRNIEKSFHDMKLERDNRDARIRDLEGQLGDLQAKLDDKKK